MRRKMAGKPMRGAQLFSVTATVTLSTMYTINSLLSTTKQDKKQYTCHNNIEIFSTLQYTKIYEKTGQKITYRIG